MRAGPEIEEHADGRSSGHAAPTPPHLSPPAEAQTVAPRRIAAVILPAAHEHDQDATVIDVHGEIDLETTPLLREVLLPVLEHQTGPVVLDLSDVSFMDSTGVHVLVDSFGRLSLEKRRLAIACREGGQVHRLLSLLGLLEALAVHRSRESAVSDGDDLLESGRNMTAIAGDPQRKADPSASRQATDS
jgi:anti-sigma B factor antagonist